MIQLRNFLVTATGTHQGDEVSTATSRRRGIMLRVTTMTLATGLLFGGIALTDPHPAFAQACVGENERVAQDFSDVGYTIKIDSCHAAALVDSYGDVKDAAGLAGALGAKWWPVGVASGIFFAWAWNNQAEIKSAAAAGRGVQFDQQNGIIHLAEPQ